MTKKDDSGAKHRGWQAAKPEKHHLDGFLSTLRFYFLPKQVLAESNFRAGTAQSPGRFHRRPDRRLKSAALGGASNRTSHFS